ncbi:hypothetical protein FHR81_001130 [Actinoalloteichus hoggarensis]|uniref:Uncharacterized protein n=1 Tax=Actinoalloteichus hoggarensis TaxID=1470176 RepID=A0A221VZA1_9PSEU|nr:hypothetical protein [Actinoalloteichus hoggarensis]ASO18865.1 hypothetical protein AHOG_06065 [Actinoalloteichus hoggarensis]MBB5920100.1 hypothetical protein [Actinoalloteichus hoggarensis]
MSATSSTDSTPSNGTPSGATTLDARGARPSVASPRTGRLGVPSAAPAPVSHRVPLDVAVGAGAVAVEPWVMWETLIAAVQRWTVQPADALRHHHGITVYDFRLLRLLARAAQPMRKAIAHTALDLPPRSLDHSISRLAERGYLTVTGRGGQKRLALTDFGIEFLEAVVETLRAATADGPRAASLPPRERAVLIALLNRLRR